MWIIYCITNILNNKIYIGQTKNLLKYRFSAHLKAAYNFNSSSYKTYFAKSIRKYGKDSWKIEILEDNINDIEMANQREEFWIKEKSSNIKDIGYNSNSGGNQREATPELIHKLSISHLKQRPKHRKFTDEQIIKIRKDYFYLKQQKIKKPIIKIADKYQCSYRLISAIVNNNLYKSVIVPTIEQLPLNHKVCSVCNNLLHNDNFYYCSSTFDFFNPRCKKCDKLSKLKGNIK